MTIPTHRIIPDPATGYALNPERGWVSVYLPHGATNLIPNPSFEVSLDDWASLILGAGGSFARVADAQFRGAYCAEVDLGAGASGDISTTGTGAAGVRYAFSAHVRRPGGGVVRLEDVEALLDGSTGTPFQTVEYVADGWYRLGVSWVSTTTSGPGMRFYGAGQVFYVDAVQWEAGGEPSTYLDGDELGLIPGETPPAFTWNGAAHASTSTRSATTRAGGLRRNLSDFGLTVVGLLGLGMPPQGNQTVPYAGQDGSFYQGARRPERSFTIAGAFQADTPLALDQRRRDLRAALTFDRTGTDSPIVLELQAYAGATAIGEAVACVCSYASGLESNQASLYAEKVAIQLVEHVPGLTGLASRGGAFPAQATPTLTYVAYRDERTGAWSYPTGLNAAPQPNAVIFGPDEKLYVGGNFTAPSNRVARYNFQTGQWESLSGGLSAQVNALAFDREGRLLAGGASGLITGSTVARWSGSSWSAIGANADTVRALAYDAATDRIYAGGANGANATLRYSTGAGWTAITAATAGEVYDLAFDAPSGTLYIAGNFSAALGGVANAVYVARYTAAGGIAPLGAGANATAQSVAVDPQGRAWFLGSFTTFDGVAVGRLAVWTGQSAEAVPGVTVPLVSSNGYVAASPFTGDVWAGGVELTALSGTAWLQRLTPAGPLWPGIGVANSTTHVAAAFSPARTAVARDDVSSGLLYEPQGAAISNPGTLPAPVVVVLRSGASLFTAHAVYGPTGATVDLGIVIVYQGDVLTVDSRPERLAVASVYQGDLRGRLRLGSRLAALLLPPGASTLRVQCAIASPPEQAYFFRPRYGALGDAAR